MNRPRSSQPAFRIAFITTLTFVGLAALGTTARATPGNVVISQVYGGGGTTYANDFIELHNRGNTPVSLVGWSVQYTSAAGSTWTGTLLNGSIPAGGYYLVREALGSGGGGLPLPAQDALGSITMSATDGKVALVSNTTLLTGTSPSGGAIVDLLGYGAASGYEGAPAGALTTTTAALRGNAGCTDTDNNANNFSSATPAPRNSVSAIAKCELTLTYLAGSNGSITGDDSQTVTLGDDGTEVSAVPATGYHFVKWSDDRTDNPRTDLDVTADITVTASFAITQYALKYLPGDHGSITGTAEQTVDHGADGSEVTAVPATGYHFVKWSDDNTANPRIDENVIADLTVTAEYAINQYTLKYLPGDHGSITGTSEQTVDHGADGSEVAAVAEAGYHFVKWSDDKTDNPRTDLAVTSNLTVTATYSISQYALTVNVAPSSTGSVAPGSGSHDFDSIVELIATPDPGYHFDHWAGALNSGANPIQVTMNTNKTITAHFVSNQMAGQMVISQFFGGGGDNATGYKNDFVELYNRGNGPVSIAEWSIQYASATGTDWSMTSLAGIVPPGHHLLIKLHAGGSGTLNLPLADVIGTTDLSATDGKLALVSNTTLLTDACPSGIGIIDLVGYGSADCSEDTPTGELINTAASFRGHQGCDETDNNLTDFSGDSPAPRNSLAPAHFCDLWLDVEPAPTQLSLSLTGANPVIGRTRFSLALPEAGLVRIDIADVQGRRVASILNDYLAAGRHELSWDGASEAGASRSGLYYLTVQALGRRIVRSFVLMR